MMQTYSAQPSRNTHTNAAPMQPAAMPVAPAPAPIAKPIQGFSNAAIAPGKV